MSQDAFDSLDWARPCSLVVVSGAAAVRVVKLSWSQGPCMAWAIICLAVHGSLCVCMAAVFDGEVNSCIHRAHRDVHHMGHWRCQPVLIRTTEST